MKRSHLLLLAGLLVAGCERHLEDPIFAYGSALDGTGAAWSGAALTVERAERLQGRDPASSPVEYQPFRELTSAADGEFVFEVLLRDARWLQRGQDYVARQFRASTPVVDGRQSWLTFDLYDDVELPPLGLWKSDLRTDERGLWFAAAPPAVVRPPSAKVMPAPTYPDGTEASDQGPPPVPVVQLLSGADGALVWQQTNAASPWRPSPWILEDFPELQAQVRAATWGAWYFEPLGGRSSQTQFRLDWRSERVPWPSGAMKPISRGTPGWPEVGESCPWTDGKLESVALASEHAISADELGVVLPRRAHLTRAVVRGLYVNQLDYWESSTGMPTLEVEGSSDGTDWVSLGTAPVEGKPEMSLFSNGLAGASPGPGDPQLRTQRGYLFGDIPLSANTEAMRVRLKVMHQGMRLQLWEIAELSLFE